MIKREEIYVLFGTARLLEVQAIKILLERAPEPGYLKRSTGTGLFKKRVILKSLLCEGGESWKHGQLYRWWE
jgi:hypothetical protein